MKKCISICLIAIIILYSGFTGNVNAVYAEDEFSLEKYIADIWTGEQEQTIDLLLELGLSSRIVTDLLDENAGFQVGVNSWEKIHELLEPSEIAEGYLDKQGYYNAVLLSVFLNVNNNELHENDITDKIWTETEDIISVVKTWAKTSDDLEYFGKVEEEIEEIIKSENIDDILPETRAKMEALLLKKYKENHPDLEYMDNMADMIGKIFKMTETVADAIVSISYNLQLMELSEGTKDVIKELYDVCPDTNLLLKNALKEICLSLDSQLWTIQTVVYNSGKEIVADFVGEAVDELWIGVVSTNPYAGAFMAGAQIGNKIGTAISNTLFSTEETIEQYYKMKVLGELYDLLCVVIENRKEAYINSKSVENANQYISAITTFFEVERLGCDFCINLADVLYNDAALGWLAMSGKEYESYVESCSDLKTAFQRQETTLWYYCLLSLKEEYPEIYSSIFGEEIPEQGDTIYFGTYPQSKVDDIDILAALEQQNAEHNDYIVLDGNWYIKYNSNYYEYEPIAWKVLSVDDSKVFVVAEKTLDAQAYNTSNVSITWEACTLRSWLNEAFLEDAFTIDEQIAILTTSLQNERNPYWSYTKGGNATEDKIFILSYADMINTAYGFDAGTADSLTRCAMLTEYAKERANTSPCASGHGIPYGANATDAIYWLRNPGHAGRCACTVKPYGCSEGQMNKQNDQYYGVFDDRVGVRPAMYLNIELLDNVTEKDEGITEKTITVKSDGNGMAGSDKGTAAVGEIVNLKAVANDGYEFKEWVVLEGNVTLESAGSARTSFVMPEEKVVLKACFEKIEEEMFPTPEDDVASFVSRLYTLILGREADELGLEEWTGYLENGVFTGAEVAQGFIMSDEFLNKEMTNEEFVRILYSAFFGREADPDGLATWVSFLNQGFRKSYIFAGFANSEEFAALCEGYGVEAGAVPVTISEQQPNLSDTDYNVWLFVERMYTEVLERTPDMDGIQDWVALLKAGTWTGAQVAAGFILSEEFQAKEMSNEEYVQLMYLAFFGREADEDGLEIWVTALETDYTKEYIFAGFANSVEFGVLCETYGITQGSVDIPEQ